MSNSQSQRDQSFYPQNGSYQPQFCQDTSNILGMYQDEQKSNLLVNQVIVPHSAWLRSEVDSSPINRQYQAYPSTGQNLIEPEQSLQLNPWAIYQYYYPPPPNHCVPGHFNYPPPTPPACQWTPQVSESTQNPKRNLLAKAPEETLVEVAQEKEIKKPPVIMVGRRRGGRILPTGIVKKSSTENKSNNRGGKIGDSFLAYKAEVRRYTDKLCESEGSNNRPLVK